MAKMHFGVRRCQWEPRLKRPVSGKGASVTNNGDAAEGENNDDGDGDDANNALC